MAAAGKQADILSSGCQRGACVQCGSGSDETCAVGGCSSQGAMETNVKC